MRAGFQTEIQAVSFLHLNRSLQNNKQLLLCAKEAFGVAKKPGSFLEVRCFTLLSHRDNGERVTGRSGGGGCVERI